MTMHNFIREMMPTARRTLLAFLVVFVVFAASPAQVRAQDPAQPRYDAALDLLMARHFSAAIEAFRALAVEYPDSKLVDDAQFHLGVCYTLLGQHDLAVVEYYRVALDYPQSDLAPEALVKAAEVLAALDFYQDAISMFRKVLEDYPGAEPAAYAQTCIGWLYGGMGDTEKAKAALEKVATHYPDSPYVEIARESLKKLNETVLTGKLNKPKITLRCNTVDPIEGKPVGFVATVSDQDSQDELTYQWYLDGQPIGWTGLSPKWQDPQPGTHNVTIRISDGKVKLGKAVVFTVAAAAPPPRPPVSSIIDQILLLDSIPPSPSNQKNVFSPGDAIYIWVESKILNKPHKLEIVWIDPSGKEIKRKKFDLRGWGSKETVWPQLQTERQTPRGRWQVKIYVDGRIDRAIYFILKS